MPPRNGLQLVIRSGAQTGVDRAALDAALAAPIPYVGWCPKGGGAEDLYVPPGVLAKYPNLKETPLADPSQRSAWNVRDSDATLILLMNGDPHKSPGTAWTLQCAGVWKKPLRVVDMAKQPSVDELAKWIAQQAATLNGRPFDLNIAGPRESQSPGIYRTAREFIGRMLQALPPV